MSSVNTIFTEICKRTRLDTLTKSGTEWLTKLASTTKVTDLDTQIKPYLQAAAILRTSTEIQDTLTRQEEDIIYHMKLAGRMLR